MTFQPEQTILDNRYELVKRIGQGSYGEVWLALHLLTQVQVAIKVGRIESAKDRERAIREMHVSNSVDHIHLLAAKTVEEDNEHLYLILPYADGGSLKERLANEKYLPVDEAIEIAIAVAQGLSYLHENDWVHRDIHPGNILFREKMVKLCDFGLIQSRSFSDVYGLQVGGRHPGNAFYLPPEAWAISDQPLKPLHPNADVYMVGAVLWEMLIGQVYYHKQGDRPGLLRNEIPDWLDNVVMECLATDPSLRPRDGNELAHRLNKGKLLARQIRLETLYREAKTAFEQSDWHTVIERLNPLLNEAPRYLDAEKMLALAKDNRREEKRQEQIQALTTKADSALQQRNWAKLEQAVTELESIDQSIAQPYKEPLQAHKEKERQLTALYQQAKKAFDSDRWKTAIRHFEALLDKSSQNYGDAETLLAQARQKQKLEKEAQRKAQEIQALVQKAQTALDERNWETLRAVTNELKLLSSEQTKPFEKALEAETERRRKQQARWDEQYKQAQIAFGDCKWATSIDALKVLLAENPNYPGAKHLLARSQDKQQREEAARREQQEIRSLVEQAQLAQSNGEWRTLRDLVSSLETRAPDKAKPFSQALQARWTDLYQQGKRVFDNGKWQAAVDILQNLVDEVTTDHKVKDLLARAKEAQREAEEAQHKQQQIQSLKTKAQEAHQQQDWKTLRTLVAQLELLSSPEAAPFKGALAQESQRRRRQLLRWGSIVSGSLVSLFIFGVVIFPYFPGIDDVTPTPTASATATSAPIPSEIAGIVSSDGELALRFGPGLQFGLLTTLPSNTRVTATARDETFDWLFVHTTDDTQGWVSAAASSVKWSDDTTVLPVSSTLIPTPTSTPSHTPTPTRTSTPTPTDIPDEVVGVVAADSLRIRAGPGTAFDVLASVVRGEKVVAIARDGSDDWALSRLSENSEGWLVANFVEWENDLAILPVQDVETPTATATKSPTPTKTPTKTPSATKSPTKTPTNTSVPPTFTPTRTPTSQPLPPAPASFSGQIAYVSTGDNSDIYLMDIDGSGNTNITNDPAGNFYSTRNSYEDLTASPNGAHLAYVARHKDTHLYLVNTDGTEKIGLSNNTSCCPAWSPDGNRIAYADRRHGNYDIFLIDADGNNLVRLTTDSSNIDRYPTWSPDGTKLAFNSSLDDGTTYEIHLINVDGTGHVKLTDGALSSKHLWSPDSQRILFKYDEVSPGVQYQVYTINVDGSGQTRLTQDSENMNVPIFWSLDGNRIYFLSGDFEEAGIDVMNSDGTSRIQILGPTDLLSTLHDDQISVSPDRMRMVFGRGVIYKLNSDGSGLTNLTEGWSPVWVPN